MAKFLKWLILVPIAIIIIAFAVANRQIVTISFDPFAVPGASTAVVALPLFIVLFLLLIVGTFIGGVATWFTQGRIRRRARRAEDAAEHWHGQVRRIRDQQAVAPAASASTSRSLARSNS